MQWGTCPIPFTREARAGLSYYPPCDNNKTLLLQNWTRSLWSSHLYQTVHIEVKDCCSTAGKVPAHVMQICMGLSVCAYEGSVDLQNQVAFVMPCTDLLLSPPWRNPSVKKQSFLPSWCFLTRPNRFLWWPEVKLIFTTDLFYSSEVSARSWVKAFPSVCLRVSPLLPVPEAQSAVHTWMIYSESLLLPCSIATLLHKLAGCWSGNIPQQSQQHWRKTRGLTVFFWY